MAHWKFMLCDSADLRTPIAELSQARQRQLQVILNRAGSLSFTYPMRDELASSINPVTSAVVAYRQNRTGAWQAIWSGPVWTIDEQIQDARMTVNCIGWQEMLNKRLLRAVKSYASWDDADIIYDLLAEANRTSWTTSLGHDMGYTVPVLAGSYPATPTRLQMGAKLPNEGVGGATAYTTALRSKNYERYVPIGAAIQELTEYENGCDIEINPITRELNIYRRKMKVTTEVFGYEWGPANLQQFQRQHDASTLVNLIQVMGAPGTTAGYADTASPPFPGLRIGSGNTPDPDPDTRDDYGLIEEVVSLPDVNNTTILATYAAGEILMRYRPRITYTLTPFPYTKDNNVPEPFYDYNVGDKVLLSAVMPPRVSIENQAVRVFGMSVQIDEEGNERIGALQTGPGG